MSTIVGEVSSLEGIVRAIDPVTQGVRVLGVGDSVFENEILMTSSTGHILINMDNGEILTLGRNSELRLDADIIGSTFVAGQGENVVDVEALQQAILEGDINDLEATAAGEAGIPGSASQGGIVIARTGSEGNVTAGFDTGTQQISLNQVAQEEVPLVDTSPRIIIEDTDGAVTAQNNSVVEASSSTVTGIATVSAPNGIGTVLVAGQDVTNASTVPVVIVGSEGTLTITSFDGSVITYSYTENGVAATHDASNNNVIEHFTVELTDLEGVVVTDILDIQIIDTAPVADADIDAIAENAVSIIGNVMSNDAIGADTTNVTAISGGTVGSAFATSYGTLTVNADGSYSYLLNNGNSTVQALGDGQSLTETFSYTITDADGDLSTTSLVLTINGVSDDMPTIDMGVGSHTVVEATGDTVTGSMVVTADAGFGAVTIAGQDITNASNVSVVIGGAEGTLTITGFNTVTGVISYSYTEDGNAEMHNAANDNVFDQFAVLVTDTLGQSVNDTLTVTIDDTAPTANADSRTIGEDNTGITGNVMTGTNGLGADSLGADATVVSGVSGVSVGVVGSEVEGSYGSLTLNADGSYEYTLDNTNESVQALDDGESLTEIFSYTITDADGDSSSSRLTITVGGATDTPSTDTENHPCRIHIADPLGAEGSHNSVSSSTRMETTTAGSLLGPLVTPLTAGETVAEVETFNFNAEGWMTHNIGGTETEDRALLLEPGTSAEKTYDVDPGETVTFRLDLMTQGNWDHWETDTIKVFINDELLFENTDEFSGNIELVGVADNLGKIDLKIESGADKTEEMLHVENVEVIRAINIENILYADDNATEDFTISAGQDMTIMNFDQLVDTLDISDVFEGLIVQPNSLNEYLCFNFGDEDTDGDGNKDVDMITIDADGDATTQNDITKIYLENSRFDSDDMDDLNIDYQNQ
ncbi:MAG: hypothetical protein ISEC1_P0351 [Thiomicrorhabdus sp.]|nr:MAG: hypothetical protein ISEC1_P0351 [Thiomicrorhabdus sp.]